MKNSRAIIAVLTDRYIPYQAKIVESIAAELNELDYGILCITAKSLQAQHSTNDAHVACNSLYHDVEEYGVAGLIALSGTLGHGVDENTVSQFLNTYQLPKVSFGLNLPNIPSVYFEEYSGMNDLMNHLLTNKKRKRFAFVRGHRNDPYSQRREEVFRVALNDQGHSDDNIFYIEGDYDPFTAYQAVTNLLNNNEHIDCIVAANDVMAASAAHATKAHGLIIPTDIVISGFDDSSESTQHSPALTTIRQPLSKMAHDSVVLLLEQIERQHQKSNPTHSATDIAAARTIITNSELVVRRSTNATDTELRVCDTIDESQLNRLLNDAMYGLKTPDQASIKKISESLWRTLHYGSIDLFSMATQLSDATVSLHSHWWLNLCDQIQLISDQLLECNHDVTNIILVSSAISKIQERIWSMEIDRKFEASRLENERADMQLAMSSCNDIEDIICATNEWLSKLKPKRSFLIRYNNFSSRADTTARVIHAFRNGVSETPHSIDFHSSKVLPEQLEHELESGLLVFSPIYAGNVLFGYLLVDPSNLKLLYIDEAARCIGNAMRTHHHITTLQAQKNSLQSVNAELEQHANFDALTGLANRLQFQQYLDTCTDEQGAGGNPFALLFIDLDGFKQINDTLGHNIGDQLLHQVAQRLLSCVSSSSDYDGFISRLGGDEFIVILHQTNEAAILETISQELLALVSSPYIIDDNEVLISASIGCASYPEDATDAHALVKNADTAMYYAKNNGKNSIAFFSSSMNNVGTEAFSLLQNSQHSERQITLENKNKAA